jgi:hypothetical protein
MEPEDLLRCVVVACEQLKLRYLEDSRKPEIT